MKFKLLLILLISCSVLSADLVGFEAILEKLLKNNSEYQQVLSNFEREIGRYYLNKSTALPELNISYQKYSNDILRDELKTSTIPESENTTIDENDERWRIELSKQFFPKDFDHADDTIGSAIELMVITSEMFTTRDEALSDIFDDMTDLYEADVMIKVLEPEINVLLRENAILDELEKNNIIDPADLIDNLKELDAEEKKLNEFRETSERLKKQYGNVNQEFVELFFSYSENDQADTLMFNMFMDIMVSGISEGCDDVTRKIKRNKVYAWLPEIRASVSYNWRNIDQEWDIKNADGYEFWDREQTEAFPEIKLELSLPLDFVGNMKGKSLTLKAYEHEVMQNDLELTGKINDLKIERLSALEYYKNRLLRKQQISRLREKQAKINEDKYLADPTLLGELPQLELEDSRLKVLKAEAELKIAEMRYYKQVYLINNFGVSR